MRGVNSILYTPGFSELFDTAHESPELDRVLGDMARHMRAGRYDADRTCRCVERFVVETSAIELNARDGDTRVSWFTRYPRALRAEVARRIVRGWEREIGGV
jgi:hypothetical protein